MATLLAHILVRAGQEARWETITQDMVAKTLANEDGVIRYEYWRRPAEREYLCLLAFRDKEAFLTHQAADYHVERPWAEMIESIDLEWVDPVAGAAPLGPTRDTPLPPDATEALRVWEAQSPVQESAWWSKYR